MAGLSAVIAATTGTSAAQAESRAVSLNMTQTLAVVALLSLGGTGQGAAVGLMACSKKSVVVRAVKNTDGAIPGCLPVKKSALRTKVRPGKRRTVVAKSLSRGADLSVVANVATLVAGTSRERRHIDKGL